MKRQNKTCAIIIPIYKYDIDIMTTTSINSLIKSASDYTKENYPIILVSHEDLNDIVQNILREFNNSGFNAVSEFFDKKYFESIDSYCQLLKSYDFWERFQQFDYVLIYQDDCLLIKDDLKEWIKKDYDYIGAPVISQKSGWSITPVVGNGGCSLRKVKWFMDVTDPNGKFLQKYKSQLESEDSAKESGIYKRIEDVYFLELVAYYYGIKVPEFNEAADFSFDMNPDILVKLKKTQNQFPSFIHAYDKNLRWYDKNTDLKTLVSDYESLWEYSEKKWEELHKYYMADVDNPTSLTAF